MLTGGTDLTNATNAQWEPDVRDWNQDEGSKVRKPGKMTVNWHKQGSSAPSQFLLLPVNTEPVSESQKTCLSRAEF